MKKLDVVIALEKVREAKEQWKIAQWTFNTNVSDLMHRLLHEAAHNFMPVEEIAKASGFTTKRVREMMRYAGLDPKRGKRVLSKQAAEALANNSALMGIEPHEMDLTSPLAYLPMGSVMKRELQDKQVSQVHEVSGNPLAELLVELRNEYSRPMSDSDQSYWDRYEDVNDVLTRIESVVKGS